MFALTQGVRRRMFRLLMRVRVRRGRVGRKPGSKRLPGYRLQMQFPDELIWVNQFLEIFGDDCYGAGTLPGKAVVIDGGANVGVFTRWVKWLRPHARVIAVEPCPTNVEYLRVNLDGLSAYEVNVVEAALGSTADAAVTIGGATSDTMRIAHAGEQTVPSVSLAELIEGRVDLLKLDIEGGELDALVSAGDALRRVRRAVIEYHQFPDNRRRLSEVIAVLEEQGFDRFGLSGHREFARDDPGLPDYCCLLKATRSRITSNE